MSIELGAVLALANGLAIDQVIRFEHDSHRDAGRFGESPDEHVQLQVRRNQSTR